MQKLYHHNSFFGWLNSFKILPTNLYLGRPNSRTVAPPIIPDPTFEQVAKNWNFADTGALLTIYLLGILYSKRVSNQVPPATYIQLRRSTYFMLTNIFLAFGVSAGLINSANRLRGIVPNGLTWELPQAPRLKKYDYTSDFLQRNAFIRWFVPFEL